MNSITQEEKSAREIIDIAIRYNKSIRTVMDFIDIKIEITDGECEKIVANYHYPYEHIRNSFD